VDVNPVSLYTVFPPLFADSTGRAVKRQNFFLTLLDSPAFVIIFSSKI